MADEGGTTPDAGWPATAQPASALEMGHDARLIRSFLGRCCRGGRCLRGCFHVGHELVPPVRRSAGSRTLSVPDSSGLAGLASATRKAATPCRSPGLRNIELIGPDNGGAATVAADPGVLEVPSDLDSERDRCDGVIDGVVRSVQSAPWARSRTPCPPRRSSRIGQASAGSGESSDSVASLRPGRAWRYTRSGWMRVSPGLHGDQRVRRHESTASAPAIDESGLATRAAWRVRQGCAARSPRAGR